MQDVAVSLADGPYHSGSVQGLYHPNHQVRNKSLIRPGHTDQHCAQHCAQSTTCEVESGMDTYYDFIAGNVGPLLGNVSGC